MSEPVIEQTVLNSVNNLIQSILLPVSQKISETVKDVGQAGLNVSAVHCVLPMCLAWALLPLADDSILEHPIRLTQPRKQ